MSKSPKRAHRSTYQYQYSPYNPTHPQPKPTSKEKPTRPTILPSTQKRSTIQDPPRSTTKKIYQHQNYSKPINLQQQNDQLYRKLDERTTMVNSLKKRLEQQVLREISTLEQIDQQKKKFTNDTYRKMKQYQFRILQLSEENTVLVQVNQQLKQQLNTLQDILKQKTIEFNSQIVELNHNKNIQISQLKIQQQNIIDRMNRDFIQQHQQVVIQHDNIVKQLRNLVTVKDQRQIKMGDQLKNAQIQKNIREQQLLEKNGRLEREMQNLDQFTRKLVFEQAQKMKRINQKQLVALEEGNQAIVKSLTIQNTKLMNLISNKTQQIDKLMTQLTTQRDQHQQQTDQYHKIIQQLKSKMKQQQKLYLQENQRLKIKLTELRSADIKTLSSNHQHQMQLVNQQLQQKIKELQQTRGLLYKQLEDKNQLRKGFQLQILTLNKKIAQYQIRLNELLTVSKQENANAIAQMLLTSASLKRDNKQKQSNDSKNQQEKKQLQQLIIAKDKEIEELNKKIILLKQNHNQEINNKNSEIALLRKDKNDLQLELKKQKYFYDNQIKRKDTQFKNLKEKDQIFIQNLKKQHALQFQNATQASQKQKIQLKDELNRSKTHQKILKIQIQNLQKQKIQQSSQQQKQLKLQKQRLQKQHQNITSNLKKYFQDQMNILSVQIADLKKKLLYKSDELRNQHQKYRKLQQKIQKVIQSQQKLRDIQNMVMELGQQNNLIKNIAEIVKNPIKM